MWSPRCIQRIDMRMIPVILGLMLVSLLVIASTDPLGHGEGMEEVFWTPRAKKQLQWFVLGWGVYLFFAGFDYNKLREWAWILYAMMLVALLGVFLVDPIQNVHRWFKIPFTNFEVQPSEGAKLIVVIVLSWFLERMRPRAHEWKTAFAAGAIVGIPFLLILKQPDLGTALVLGPITLVMFYFGDLHPWVVRGLIAVGLAALLVVLCFFLGVVSHDDMRPTATKFLKEYQYERLNPNTHHQKASATAVALGGLTGSGWRQSEFTGQGWLPYAYTDSVFPAFGEEFGFLGLLFVLVLFYALIYFGFQVTVVSKDHFGRMLSAGVSIYLAMHIIINIGMMCCFLPVTGLPLILVSYGGSSVLVTMAALGILQSIYSRRFMF